MSADKTRPQDHPPAWTQRADRPAGVFASYAGPESGHGRDRARVTCKSMFSIYIVLLCVTAAFGVFSAYQWERAKDAAEQAELIADQNEALAQRVKELESLGVGLADMVALAYEAAPADLLARLDEMEQRRPDVGGNEIFTRLWIGAKDRESQLHVAGREQQQDEQPQFETASGGDPTLAAPASPAPAATPPPAEIAKAEPVPQDQTKADQVVEPAKPDGTDRIARVEAAGTAEREIVVVAKEETWIQINDAEGNALFTRLMKAGERRALPEAAAALITGNPTGLTVSVGGVDAPAFNPKGPTRREIALDPQRLLDGSAELPARK